ncbi:MAG: hypothetical protein LAP61_20365 [Acidobacteriia bacterium]|nr:hypothetical protein [Terriglobia bacterium]
MKLAVVAPEETVMLAGTVAFALLLDSATAKPPDAAVLLSVTVQEAVPGAFTLSGVQLNPLKSTAALNATVAVLLCPP